MITIRDRNERAPTKIDWLDSKHSFSFSYYQFLYLEFLIFIFTNVENFDSQCRILKIAIFKIYRCRSIWTIADPGIVSLHPPVLVKNPNTKKIYLRNNFRELISSFVVL